jgi:hypothetical protein
VNQFKPSTRALAATSVTTTALFPVIVIALNVVQRRSYSPARQAISELALGPGGVLMVLAFCGLGAGIATLAVTVRRAAANARVVPAILGIAAILAGPGSAAFHTDRTGAATTLHGTIHNTAGLVAFLLLLAAMVIASLGFRRDDFWRGHAATTTVLAGTGLVTFFLVPLLGNDHFGLAQRLFVGTFVTWLIVTAAYAHHRLTATAAQPTEATLGDLNAQTTRLR